MRCRKGGTDADRWKCGSRSRTGPVSKHDSDTVAATHTGCSLRPVSLRNAWALVTPSGVRSCSRRRM